MRNRRLRVVPGGRVDVRIQSGKEGGVGGRVDDQVGRVLVLPPVLLHPGDRIVEVAEQPVASGFAHLHLDVAGHPLAAQAGDDDGGLDTTFAGRRKRRAHRVAPPVVEPAQVEHDPGRREGAGAQLDDGAHVVAVVVAARPVPVHPGERDDQDALGPVPAGVPRERERVPELAVRGVVGGGEVEGQRRAPVMGFAPFRVRAGMVEGRRGVSLALLTVSTAISARWAGPGQGWERLSD
jgi:hypothetical protein